MKSLKQFLPEGWFRNPYDDRSVEGTNDPASVAALKALPQPISVNGGSYSYRCDVNKTPIQWVATDGAVVTQATNLRAIAKWLDTEYVEDWLGFLDGDYDLTELIQERVVRPGKDGQPDPKNQSDHEHKHMMGDSVDPDISEIGPDLDEAKKAKKPVCTFQKIDYEQFERAADSSSDYDEDSVNGFMIGTAYNGSNCIAVYYIKAQYGSYCPEFVGDAMDFTDADTNYPSIMEGSEVDDIRRLSGLPIKEEIVDETNYHSHMPTNAKAGDIALAIVYDKYDDPVVTTENGDDMPFESIEDADEEGSNTSAYHHSVYQFNGMKWIKKVSRTEPPSEYSSGGGYGDY